MMDEDSPFNKTLLEAIAETSVDGILVVNDERKIILFNRHFIEMCGITQEIADSKDDAGIFKDVLIRLKDPYSFAQKIEYLHAHRDEKSIDQIELKDGRIFDRHSSPLVDSAGNHYGRIWYFRDVTEHKNQEKELKCASEEWARTFNAVSDLIFIMDKDHTIIQANKNFFNVLKLKPEDAIGKKCYQVLHKLNKPWPQCPAEKTKLDKVSHTEEVDDPNIGIPLLITTSPILDEKGELIAIVHTAKDISERKRVEGELKKKIGELERFKKITIGRELRMKELKAKVAELESKLGGK